MDLVALGSNGREIASTILTVVSLAVRDYDGVGHRGSNAVSGAH